jgi:nitrate/TMAO reductase-like tetraheme cytochrome c subunit
VRRRCQGYSPGLPVLGVIAGVILPNTGMQLTNTTFCTGCHEMRRTCSSSSANHPLHEPQRRAPLPGCRPAR